MKSTRVCACVVFNPAINAFSPFPVKMWAINQWIHSHRSLGLRFDAEIPEPLRLGNTFIRASPKVHPELKEFQRTQYISPQTY